MSQIEPSKIIYSKRKTLCLQITREGEFIVRAPKKASPSFIQNFILQKQDWIYSSILKITQKRQNIPKLDYTPDQIKELKSQSRIVLKDSLDNWSEVMNLKYTKFRLSSAKTRWGSCSGRDVISLNWRLILTAPDLINYVVIHELAHVKQKNHSDKFWSLVEKYDPDYKAHRKSLKANQSLVQI
jgi:predicted metal-dependent hydrolase